VRGNKAEGVFPFGHLSADPAFCFFRDAEQGAISPMLSYVRQLRERRCKLHADAQALLKKGTMTGEDRRKFDLMMAEIDTLKEDIDRAERSDLEGAALSATRRPPEAQIGQDVLPESSEDRRYRAAFADYLRNGLLPSDRQRGMSDENRALLTQRRSELERRDMGISIGSEGGYFVPQGFVYQVETALKYYGPMIAVSRILDTATGNPLPYPTSNDVSNTGILVGEGVQVTDQDVTVGHIMFGAYKFSTQLVKVSLELLQDSAFDIEAFLKDAFAIRLGRILNTYFTTGSGSNCPTGFLTAIANNGGTPVTAQGSAANTGGSQTGANSIGYVDLVELEHSIDPLYRVLGSRFVLHDTSLKSIKEILDKYGRPIWMPGVAAGAPDTILGYEYAINNDMAQIAASATTVGFGPFKKYLIRRVKEMAVLRLVERFADYGQVAFVGFARYDGNLLDAGTHPLNTLVQAA
jgi:HK97 family phage major capsid protein